MSAHSLCENVQMYQTFESISSVRSPEKGHTTRLVTWCLQRRIEAERVENAVVILNLESSVAPMCYSVLDNARAMFQERLQAHMTILMISLTQ